MTEMQFASRMSDSDALMWHIEKDPLLRSTITAVSVLDCSPDRQRLLDKIDRGSRLIPRMRQRVVGNPLSIAPPRWEFDPNFDLRYHVRFVDCGGTGTMRTVLDIAEPIAMQGFDRARPLWEFVVVDGLEDGKAAVIQKVHHAITDGVGGMQMVMVMLDLEREPAEDDGPMPAAPEPNVLSPLERTVDAITHVGRRNLGIARRARGTLGHVASTALSDPFSVVRGVAGTAASMARMLEPASEPLSPVMTGRSLSVRFETLTFSLRDLKAAAKSQGGTLNDAFVAAVAGGLRRYHDAHGVPVERLRMNMPINVRNDENANLAGNQFAPARFAVPVDLDEPAEAIGVIHDLVNAQRAEPALSLLEPMSGLLNRLPTTLTTAVFGSLLKGVDFTTSNVPGAPIPVFVAGAQVESMFPFGPLAGAALNVTLLSTVDEVNVGVNVDLAAVPDAEVLRECLSESFAEILKLS